MVWLAASLLKVAVTLFAASIVTVQVGPLLALHAPPQLTKPLPLAGVAVRVTVVPVNKLVEQTPEVAPAPPVQFMLKSSAPIVPEPQPVALILSAKVPKD
jgi:hypothetical protein